MLSIDPTTSASAFGSHWRVATCWPWRSQFVFAMMTQNSHTYTHTQTHTHTRKEEIKPLYRQPHWLGERSLVFVHRLMDETCPKCLKSWKHSIQNPVDQMFVHRPQHPLTALHAREGLDFMYCTFVQCCRNQRWIFFSWNFMNCGLRNIFCSNAFTLLPPWNPVVQCLLFFRSSAVFIVW